jgi:uncharacterized protein (TIGR03083 family)
MPSVDGPAALIGHDGGMTTIVPKAPTVEALAEVWARLDELLTGLDEASWSAPTPLPGWDVKAVVAHLIGTEAMLQGDPTPDVEIDPAEFQHVRNDMGRINEAWVASMADLAPVELLTRFRDQTARRLAVLQDTYQADWDTEGFTPAGMDTYGRFMRIRVFDCWFHEQDIRDAVGQPGGEEGVSAGAALDEMEAAIGYVVGRKAAAPAGSRVTFELTGPAARTIHVEVGDRAKVVDAFAGPATVTLTMPLGVFSRLAGGRADPGSLRGQVDIDGDVDLGERIVNNLAYTI